MEAIKEVKLTKAEEIVIDAIEAKGEFIWDGTKHPNLTITLKNLMWKEFIVRKKENCLHGNVFVAGWFFRLLIKNRNAIKLLKK